MIIIIELFSITIITINIYADYKLTNALMLTNKILLAQVEFYFRRFQVDFKAPVSEYAYIPTIRIMMTWWVFGCFCTAHTECTRLMVKKQVHY